MTQIAGVPLIIANKEALKIGFDKLETANFLKLIKLPYPWTMPVKNGNPKEIPCIIKNRFGSGSKKLGIINKDNLVYHSEISSEDDIFQEYLMPDDEEYTCGLYRTKNNEIRTIIFKRKLQGGYTCFGEVVENKNIEIVLTKLAEEINLKGSINVQLRITKKGPHF